MENKTNNTDEELNMNQNNSELSAEEKNEGSDAVENLKNLLSEKDIKIEALEKEVQELKDRLIRKAADFDNFKRRTESDQLSLLKYSCEALIKKILPVYDDLERSLSVELDEKNIEPVKEGMKLVYSNFSKILETEGLKKIDAVGQPFDFNYHEALLQRTVDNVPPQMVLEEHQAGYMYKDKVIRHSKVIVSDDNSGSALSGDKAK